MDFRPQDQPQVKESARWVEGYEIVADLAAQVPGTRLVYVADREGDLRALLDAAAQRGTPADWLVRAKHNRTLGTGEKLGDRLARSEPLDEMVRLIAGFDGFLGRKSDGHPGPKALWEGLQ